MACKPTPDVLSICVTIHELGKTDKYSRTTTGYKRATGPTTFGLPDSWENQVRWGGLERIWGKSRLFCDTIFGMYEKVVGAQATRQGYDQSHIGHIPRASRSCVISAGPCSRSRCSRNMRNGYSPKQCSTFFSVVYNFFIHPNVWGDLRRLAGMNRAYARTAPAIHLDG
jgi:hypothetical protein